MRKQGYEELIADVKSKCEKLMLTATDVAKITGIDRHTCLELVRENGVKVGERYFIARSELVRALLP